MILQAHTDWLNHWHEVWGDMKGMGTVEDPEVPARVELKDYWLTMMGGDGEADVMGPSVMLDTLWRGTEIRPEAEREFWSEHRHIVLSGVTPYWDEGGAATITAMFERDRDGHWTEDGVWEVGEWDDWELRSMVMEFDTIHTMTMTEGKLVWDEGAEPEVSTASTTETVDGVIEVGSIGTMENGE